MNRKLGTLGLLTAALITFVGCRSGEKADATGAAAGGQGLAQPVELLGQRQGDHSDLPHAGVWLIRTQEDLVKTNSATIGELGVDLAQNDVVVVGLGDQPTGGYGVQITAIQQVGDVLYVQGKTTRPALDAAVTEALTSPWCAAVIPNTSATTAHTDFE